VRECQAIDGKKTGIEPLAKSPNPQAKDGLFFSVPAL
jgi:hypothetical protein